MMSDSSCKKNLEQLVDANLIILTGLALLGTIGNNLDLKNYHTYIEVPSRYIGYFSIHTCCIPCM